MTTTYRGIIDRVVDGQAVILFEGQAEDDIDGEYIYPAETIKMPDGSGDTPPETIEGMIAVVTFDGDEVIEVEMRPDETQTRQDSIDAKLDRLSTPLSQESDQKEE
jgi:hypothetical protein